MVKMNDKLSRMIRILVMITGILVFLWFFLPFLIAGILNVGNITGMAVAFLLIFYFAFQSVIHTWVKKQWQNKNRKMPICMVMALIVLVMILTIVETGYMVSACMKKPQKNATAVVLGCRVYGERASLSLVERLEAAYEYLKENPNAACVVSGGQGNGENISEAECMKRWLLEKGIEEERIYKEENSTSTEENIAFSKEVIQENDLNENIAVITSEYHTYRACVIAEKNEMTYGSAPGSTALWLLPTFYVRELYAILAEWVL